MARPEDPKRLKVIDRFVTALKAIYEGADYHFTPREVSKRLKHWREVQSLPAYFVSADSVDRQPEEVGTQLFREWMRISVKCYVADREEDPTTQLEKCLRDVRKAIEADHRSSAAGSLGTLVTLLNVDTVEFDNGMLALEGYGYFDQGFIVCVEGDWGEL